MAIEPDSPTNPFQEKQPSSFGVILGRMILPAAITAFGIFVAIIFIKTKPVTEKAPPIRQARLVETIEVFPTDYRVEIEAMGLVEAKDLIQLNSRVSGEIVYVSNSLIPGNTVRKGEELFKLDPADFELTLLTREASMLQADASLMLEQGQQQIVKADYNLTGNTLKGEELDLVLRKPQLLQAQAAAKSAQAALESAKLNVERTHIKAPFDALIVDKKASLGTVINTSTSLATIADSSEFWVELTIPVRDIRWIGYDAAKPTHHVTVVLTDELAWQKGQTRKGKVVGLSSEVDSTSRMAKVVVSVEDPLGIKPENGTLPKLLLGSFVRGTILGEELKDVIVITRDYLHLGDILWTVNQENRLVFEKVEVLYSGVEKVVIKNTLPPNTRIITSNLSVPVEGMMLRYQGSSSSEPASANDNKNDPLIRKSPGMTQGQDQPTQKP